MTYSLDFRENVLRHIDMGSTLEAVSRLFSVGTTTIKNWMLTHIHDIRQRKVDPKQLLPYTIDHNILKEFADSQLQKAKEIMNALD